MNNKVNDYKDIIKEVISNIDYQAMTYNELKQKIENDYNITLDDLIFQKDLEDLLNDYEIFLNNKKDKYLSFRLANKYKGTISIKNNRFGFVDNIYYPDFYVNSSDFNTALDKDYVLYRINSIYDASAEVIKVIKRNYEYLVGQLYFKNNKYFLEPNDKKITKVVLVNKVNNAKSKDIVRVRINSYNDILKCEVVDILGDQNTIGIDISAIAARYGVLREFDNEVLDEVNSINVDLVEERKRRKHYDVSIYTIDSIYAKDLDDAVSIKKLDNGNYELGVYIADVSFYVREGMLVDKEALTRGTSVYLLDRVIPMLPVRLSNDLCSLNPNEDKLVISCIMEIDNQGNVVSSKLEEGIIKTTKRLSYENCNVVLKEGLNDNIDYDLKIINDLKLMKELRDVLNQKRVRRGSIDFDTTEAKVVLNENGEAIDILKVVRGESESIIEEFMIVCNESVAEFISQMELPFIYRVHDKPDNLKFQKLKAMVTKLGYTVYNLFPKEIQKLLNNLDEKDNYLKNVMLRLMEKAVYSAENIGHFGLASRNYTHFTSPIRRYPDLLVHRLIRRYIFNNDNILDDEEYQLLNDKIASIALLNSNSERSAMECEFAVIDYKKAEYMQSFISYIFEGVVTSIHKFGIFVTLDNTVDGLISKDNLYFNGYIYEEYHNCFINRKGIMIKLGDRVKVKVANANKKTSEIDFELIEERKQSNKVQKKTSLYNKGDRKRGKHKGYRKK